MIKIEIIKSIEFSYYIRYQKKISIFYQELDLIFYALYTIKRIKNDRILVIRHEIDDVSNICEAGSGNES